MPHQAISQFPITQSIAYQPTNQWVSRSVINHSVSQKTTNGTVDHLVGQSDYHPISQPTSRSIPFRTAQQFYQPTHRIVSQSQSACLLVKQIANRPTSNQSISPSANQPIAHLSSHLISLLADLSISQSSNRPRIQSISQESSTNHPFAPSISLSLYLPFK